MAGSLETTATLPGAEEGSGRALPLNEQAPGFHLQDYQKKKKKKSLKTYMNGQCLKVPAINDSNC